MKKWWYNLVCLEKENYNNTNYYLIIVVLDMSVTIIPCLGNAHNYSLKTSGYTTFYVTPSGASVQRLCEEPTLEQATYNCP